MDRSAVENHVDVSQKYYVADDFAWHDQKRVGTGK